MGEIVGDTVLFGDANTEPLLGVTAPESLGIEVDALNQQQDAVVVTTASNIRGHERQVMIVVAKNVQALRRNFGVANLA